MTADRDLAAIVVAGGRGVRAGGETPKQYAPLGGRPVLRWSLDALRRHPRVGAVVAVIDPLHRALFDAASRGLDRLVVVSGGATRTESVRAGAAAIPSSARAVLIHDAARPGLTAAVIDRLLGALEEADCAAPYLPGADALKRIENGAVVADVSRDGLVRVQTPQAFRAAGLRRALTEAALVPFDDDIALARSIGLRACLVEGDPRLMKLTYPEDFDLAEQILVRTIPVTGSGFDAHRFGPGDHVTLCGVKIPHSAGLVGHSDADAAWHALTDALLGAIGMGDIGDHFPPSDPQWRGAASGVFLKHAADLVRAQGGRIVNVDVTLMCERPKIKPHREAMRESTASLLDLPLARVSVKATTTEGMGFTGREEGLAAQASVSVLLPETT